MSEHYRMTWPEIFRGLWRWFWFQLWEDWKEHRRLVNTWKWRWDR